MTTDTVGPFPVHSAGSTVRWLAICYHEPRWLGIAHGIKFPKNYAQQSTTILIVLLSYTRYCSLFEYFFDL